jgi:hypothetical protein
VRTSAPEAFRVLWVARAAHHGLVTTRTQGGDPLNAIA